MSQNPVLDPACDTAINSLCRPLLSRYSSSDSVSGPSESSGDSPTAGAFGFGARLGFFGKSHSADTPPQLYASCPSPFGAVSVPSRLRRVLVPYWWGFGVDLVFWKRQVGGRTPRKFLMSRFLSCRLARQFAASFLDQITQSMGRGPSVEA